jgi:6-pyruvoyltetrahydropterin/6-carboxytetrahydropterin synthase
VVCKARAQHLSEHESKNVESRLSRIEISKQALNFSIGHFTIFSSTKRENLHGHNFQVQCHVTAVLGNDGLLFDYAILKRILRSMCEEIDERVILPRNSPHLKISEEDNYIVAIFNGERIPFLHRDVCVLPIANTTVEEFSHYFLDKLVAHEELQDKGIGAYTVKISSSPGQYGVAEWPQT